MFHTSRLGSFVHSIYSVLAFFVAGGALHLWQLRCEGFGCTGIGIAWMAWSALLFAPSIAVGAFLSVKSGPRTWLANATRWLFWAQLALGAALGAYWLIARGS